MPRIPFPKGNAGGALKKGKINRPLTKIEEKNTDAYATEIISTLIDKVPKLPGLEQLFDKVLSEQKAGMSGLEAIIRVNFNNALKGSQRAFENILNRRYGMPKQAVDIDQRIINVNVDLTPERIKQISDNLDAQY